MGLPLLFFASVAIFTRGARWQIRRNLNSNKVHASFSATVVVGWVFSLFVLVMDIAAVVEASSDNQILGNQAKHRYGSLPLFWMTSITMLFDIAFFVVGVLFLVVSFCLNNCCCGKSVTDVGLMHCVSYFVFVIAAVTVTIISVSVLVVVVALEVYSRLKS